MSKMSMLQPRPAPIRRGLSFAFVLWVSAFFAVLPAVLHAQSGTGTITGRVLNVATNEYLTNAVVSVVGTNLSTLSEDGGAFRLHGVPAGEARLAVTYAGLDPVEARVMVTSGGTVTHDFNLTSKFYEKDVVKLGAYVVSAEREGNAKAIMEQHESVNAKALIASDAFGDVSEGNVGEFIKRMPGVSMDYVEADVRQVRIRGMDPKYTSIMVDGMPVASAGSSDITVGRRFELEQLSIASIETVEISKTPTPADNASALAGVVNLRSKGAFDRKGRQITWQTSFAANSLDMTLDKTPGPDNTLNRKLMPNLFVEYSDVYLGGKLGVIAGFNYSYTFAEQKAETVNYAAGDTDATNNDTEIRRVSSFSFRDSPKPTTRRNFNLRADFKFSPDFTGWARVDFNTYEARFYSRDLGLNFNTTDTVNQPYSMSTQTTTATGGSVSYNGGGGATNKFGQTVTWSSGLSYKLGALSADGGFQYSRATNYYKDLNYGFFWSMGTNTLSNMQLRFTRNGSNDPSIFITQLAGPDWRNLSNYTLGSFSRNDRAGKDLKYTGKVDFAYPFTDWAVPLKLKWGFAVNESAKLVKRFLNSAPYTYVGGSGAPSTNAANFAEPNYRMNFSWGTNLDGLTNIDRWYGAQLYQAHPEWFTGPNAAQQLYILQYDYKYKEQIDAGYLQTIFHPGKFSIAPGLRYERTRSWGRGPDDIGDRAARRILTGSSTGTVNTANADYQIARYGHKRENGNNYADAFGYLHMSYDITKDLLARASFHQAITRPDVANLIPGISSINETNIPPTATINNPDLKPERSKNYNLSLEYYFKDVGYLSITGFRSDIKDLQRRLSVDLGADGLDGDINYAGYRVSSWDNIASGRTKGIEFSYSQQLTFLPGVFKGLGVFANHTKVWFDNWDNFLGSPTNTSNAGFNYSYRRLTARFSGNWTGYKRTASAPAAGAASAGWAGFERERLMCDLDVDFSIGKNISLFMTARNIFNTPAITYVGRSDIVNRWAQYGSIWTFGVKGTY